MKVGRDGRTYFGLPIGIHPQHPGNVYKRLVRRSGSVRGIRRSKDPYNFGEVTGIKGFLE